MVVSERCALCDETDVDAFAGDICTDCVAWLAELEGDLEQLEAADPAIAELGRQVDAAAAALATCSFCDAPVFIDGATEHPCCGFARMAGHDRCEGCTNYAYRQMKGR